MKKLLTFAFIASFGLVGGCILTKSDTDNSQQADNGNQVLENTGSTKTGEEIIKTEDGIVVDKKEKDEADEKINGLDEKVDEIIKEREETINTGEDSLTEDDIELIDDILKEITK